MTKYVLPFLCSFGVVAALTPSVILLARRLGFVDRPREDRWHKRPTALLGGIAIFAGILASYLAFVPLDRGALGILAGMTLMFALGLADDILHLTPKVKLAGQVAAALVAVLSGLSIGIVTNPVLAGVLSVLWIVGITNALNLQDNIDGLAAGIGLAAGLCLFAYGLVRPDGLNGVPAMTLAGATLGFLLYNFHPARIFMGDSGSHLIGFLLAAMAIRETATAAAGGANLPLTIAVPLAILIVPVFDVTLVTCSRLSRREPVFRGGRDHSSHRLVSLCLSERGAVLLLVAGSALIGGGAVGLAGAGPSAAAAAAAVLTAVVLAALFFGVVLGEDRTRPDRIRIASRIGTALYIPALAFFYYKYVPLVPAYQVVLAPVLLAAAFLAWRDRRTGALFFVFAFPLINNLPYFFGIYEPSPQAPAALVLFLFFFLGILLRGKPFGDGAGEDSGGEMGGETALRKPLAAFALIVGVSAVVTFLRFADFFPFLSPGIYELAVNRFGVSAGGAIMSVVFGALNYLTGIALFFVLARTLRSRADRRKALAVFCASALLALAFGLFQRFGHRTAGNNPGSVANRLINGTFKDALSFGAFLSLAAPLLLGIFFAFKKARIRIAALLALALAVYLLAFTGSKSGVLALAVAGIGFVVFGLGLQRARRKAGESAAAAPGKRVAAWALVGVIGAGAVALTIFDAGLRNSAVVARFGEAKEMFVLRAERLWEPALRMVADYPLTGVGMGAYIIEVSNYSAYFDKDRTTPESSENYLLQVVSELGAGGLIVVAWAALALFRQFWKARRRVWRGGPDTGPGGTEDTFLWLGASMGLLAFAVNAQAHSFIGSYEIKYMFWFLAALVVGLARPEAAGGNGEARQEAGAGSAEGAGRRPKRRAAAAAKLRTGAAVLILAYAGVLVWNATHSLSIPSRTERFGLRRDFGLDKTETAPDGREFQWTREYGGIPLKIEKPDFVLPLRASHPDIREKPVGVKIFLVEDFFKRVRTVGDITLADGAWRDVAISVPEDVGREAVLLVTVSRTWNPMKATGVPDPRNLGVAVGKIVFRDGN